jgi:hypothetical protein
MLKKLQKTNTKRKEPEGEIRRGRRLKNINNMIVSQECSNDTGL